MSLWARIGCLPCCKCSCGKKKQRKVSKVAEEIGLGPYLMLMVVKSLVWVFAVITILNFPMMYVYYQGNTVVHHQNQNNSLFERIPQMFSELSLGNLGQSQIACGNANFAYQSEIVLSCSYGRLGEIQQAGLTDSDSARCPTSENFSHT